MSELRRAQLADRMRELDELQRRGEIAREEDHAAHLRMLQALDVVGRELEAGDVHHHGSESHQPCLPARRTPSATPRVVGERDVRAAVTPQLLEVLRHRGVGHDAAACRFGSRLTVMRVPRERRVDAGADRLREGFLRGPALREVARPSSFMRS